MAIEAAPGAGVGARIRLPLASAPAHQPSPPSGTSAAGKDYR